MKLIIYSLVFLLLITLILADKELLNLPCKLDKECKGSFCDLSTNRCTKGLNFEVSLSKPYLNIGDEAKVSLSVSNPFNKDIYTDITLSFGNGVELTSVEYGDQCLGSQCKLDKTKIPAGGKNDIIVNLKGIAGAESFIKAYLNYNINGRPIEIEDTVVFTIQECGNGVLEIGETSETCCEDAGCPEDTVVYASECNKKSHSCEKKLKSFVYLIFLIVSLIILIPSIKQIISWVKKHFSDKTGRPWTPQEINLLKKEFSQGKSINAIAKIHKRDEKAIMHRLISTCLVGFVETPRRYKQHGRKWTAYDEYQLRKEYSKDNDVRVISKKLGREPNAVLHRLVQLGLIGEKELMKYRRVN